MKMKRIQPLNTTFDGLAHTIKYQYFKNGLANFQVGGGFAATAVIEVIEDEQQET